MFLCDYRKPIYRVPDGYSYKREIVWPGLHNRAQILERLWNEKVAWIFLFVLFACSLVSMACLPCPSFLSLHQSDCSFLSQLFGCRELERVFSAIAQQCCPNRSDNYRRNLTDSQQLLLLPSSEDDAWDGNIKSTAVAQQLQGSCHWDTLELFMVCDFLFLLCCVFASSVLIWMASFITFF